MQETSALYRQLYTSKKFYVETKVVIGQEQLEFTEEDILSLRTTKRVFNGNNPEVGCCVCGEIDLVMYAPIVSIEKQAEMDVYIRLVSTINSERYSEWVHKGIFYIDTREVTKNNDNLDVLTIHGYDAMIKAEAEYGDSTLMFPALDIDLVNDIATKIGAPLDERSLEYLVDGYSIQYPSNYCMRETLGQIASMYAGNWIINDCGELQLIPLWNLPHETNLLIDENGDRLVFGEPPEEEDRILI